MSNRIRRAPALTAMAAAVALTLAACGGADDETSDDETSDDATSSSEAGSEDGDDGAADEAQAGGTLTVARTQSPTSLDLHTEITANNAFAIDKIVEPLLTFDAAGELQPGLATEWEISEDGLTYTFTLREGVLFNDGSELDPADVVYSIERHLEVGGPLPLHADIASVEATDDTTVTITLNAPYTPLLSELAAFSNGIVPEDLGGVDEEEFFLDPVGTGPFQVETWEQGGDIVFTRNENYWQEGLPLVDELVFTVIADDNQLVSQLQSGQVDLIDQVAAAHIETLEANDDVVVSITDSWVVEELFLNTEDEHFADPHVRRAVAHVIDRAGLVAANTFGTATEGGSLLPPSILYYRDDVALELDVAAAEEELAQSEFPDGFTTTLLVPSGNTARAQSAQVIQAGLEQIGVTVEIESVDLSVFRERFRAFDYSFMINSAVSDVTDPNGIITFQADPEGGSDSYWTHYENPEVTELIGEGRTTPDGDDREAIYGEIQEIIATDSPYVPLYYPSNVRAWGSHVDGVEVLPNGSLQLTEARVEN